jgi:predicted SnoaL-like aldol condensation-catalyzing enzyme
MPESPLVADSDTARANAAVVVGFFETVLGPSHGTGELTRYLDPGFIDHDAQGDDRGLTGVTAKLDGLWSALPDTFYVVDAVVAAGEHVAVRSRLVAPAAGSSPAAEVAFADTYRVVGGLIAEHWHVVDTASLGALLTSRT